MPPQCSRRRAKGSGGSARASSHGSGTECAAGRCSLSSWVASGVVLCVSGRCSPAAPTRSARSAASSARSSRGAPATSRALIGPQLNLDRLELGAAVSAAGGLRGRGGSAPTWLPPAARSTCARRRSATTLSCALWMRTSSGQSWHEPALTIDRQGSIQFLPRCPRSQRLQGTILAAHASSRLHQPCRSVTKLTHRTR